MPTLTIRRVPDEDHERLKRRAAAHGRSVEEEVRQLIRESTQIRPKHTPAERLKIAKEIQERWAYLRPKLSVDQYLAEKREAVANGLEE